MGGIRNKQDTLRDALRAEIADGVHPPGSRLPSEHQLMRRFDVSRTTVRRALDVLAVEGLIEREQGRGSFVTADAAEIIRRSVPTALPVIRLGIVCGHQRLGNPVIQALLELLDKRLEGIADSTLFYHNRPHMDRYRGFDALLVDGAFHTQWTDTIADCPVVVVGAKHRRLPYVVTDHRAGGELMARHVLELGHRHVGLVQTADRQHTAEFADRSRAITATLDAVGATCYPAPVYLDRGDLGAEAALERILVESDRDVSAVLCDIDVSAVHLMEQCCALGLRIPLDLSLVGYDDVATVGRLDPPLTTVRQDLAAEANALAGMLAQIQRGLPPDTCPPVMPRLIVRGSTAQPEA